MARQPKKTSSGNGNNGGSGVGHAPGLAKRPRRAAVRADAKPLLASGLAHVPHGSNAPECVERNTLKLSTSVSTLVRGKAKRGQSYKAKQRAAAIDAHVALRREAGINTPTCGEALATTLAYAKQVMDDNRRAQDAYRASPQWRLREMGTELRNLIGQTVYSPKIELRTADQQDALAAAIRAVDLAANALLDLRRVAMGVSAHA